MLVKVGVRVEVQLEWLVSEQGAREHIMSLKVPTKIIQRCICVSVCACLVLKTLVEKLVINLIHFSPFPSFSICIILITK